MNKFSILILFISENTIKNQLGKLLFLWVILLEND